MNIELANSTLSLQRDGLVALRDAEGTRVTCVSGALWITEDDRERDVVLEEGQAFTLGRPGLTLIMALSHRLPAARGAARAPADPHRWMAGPYGTGRQGCGRLSGRSASMPAQWDASMVTLRNGRTAAIRSVAGREDAEPIQRFIRGLSARSRYQRFLAGLPELPTACWSGFCRRRCGAKPRRSLRPTQSRSRASWDLRSSRARSMRIPEKSRSWLRRTGAAQDWPRSCCAESLRKR